MNVLIILVARMPSVVILRDLMNVYVLIISEEILIQNVLLKVLLIIFYSGIFFSNIILFENQAKNRSHVQTVIRVL